MIRATGVTRYCARTASSSALSSSASSSSSVDHNHVFIAGATALIAASSFVASYRSSCRCDVPLSLQKVDASTIFPNLTGHLQSEDDEHTPVFRTIPAGSKELMEEYNKKNNDGGRSERAFVRAVEGGLLNWAKFNNDDGLLDDVRAGEEEAGDDLLATSDINAAATPATVGVMDPTSVVLKRINTIRRRSLDANHVYTKKMYFYQSTQIRDDKRWRFRLFALPSSENLGKEMAYLLGTSLNLISVGSFADGESSIKIDEGVRGKEVYVVCR